MEFNEEELSRLSDEERAAIEGDEDEAEILEKIAGADDSAEDDAEDSEGDDTGAAADDTTGAADAADDAGAADDVAPVAQEFRPEFVAPEVEGAADRLAELKDQSASLAQQFSDGDIDLPTFMAEKSKLDEEITAIKITNAQADFAKKQNESTRDQRWTWEQERFFAQESSAVYKDDILRSALAASIRKLDADTKNAGKPLAWFLEEADRQVRERFKNAGKPLAWFLEEADRQVRERFNTPAVAKGKQQPKAPNLSAVPKTLSSLPAADLSETGGGEFAYLDKLDGMALERALAKMSPEQEARYLRSAA